MSSKRNNLKSPRLNPKAVRTLAFRNALPLRCYLFCVGTQGVETATNCSIKRHDLASRQSGKAWLCMRAPICCLHRTGPLTTCLSIQVRKVLLSRHCSYCCYAHITTGKRGYILIFLDCNKHFTSTDPNSCMGCLFI